MAGPAATAPIDINQIIEQYGTQGSVQDANLHRLDQTKEELGHSVETETDSLRTEANLSGQIQGAVDQILLNRARRNQEAAAFFGVNQEASNSVIQSMAQSLLRQKDEIKAAGDKIIQKQNVSFADNPLEWLVTQFELPSDIQAFNTRSAMMMHDAATLKELGDLADKQIARNNAIDANVTAEISALNSKKLLAAAEVRVQEARQRAMQAGVQIDSVRLATSQQAFSNLVALHGAQVAEEHLKLSQKSLAVNEEQKELQKKNLQLLIEKRDTDLKADKELQLNLDRATAILGMRRITTAEYERAPQATKAALFDVMSDPNTAEGRLGYDATDALDNVNKVNAPLTPELQAVKGTMSRWVAEAQNTPAWAALRPEQKHQVQQDAIMKNVKREAANIPDEHGLYSAPSMYSLNQIPAVNSTIIWKSTFAPQAAASKTKPTSAQAIYEAAFNLVSDNKMDLDRAAKEISQIYQAVAIDNSQQRDYKRLGLPSQNNYNTSIRTGRGNTAVVDMTNETQVRNFILRDLTLKKAFEAAGYAAENSGQINQRSFQ